MIINRMLAGIALASGLCGCATVLETNQQELTVQTIEDNRELVGVGCVLSNKAGRWFVMAPGRVTVQKSDGDLKVDCKRDGSGGADLVASKLNNVGFWGNLIVTAGVGYYVDRRTGNGFDYPATITVMMRPLAAPPPNPGTSGTVVY